MFSRNYLEKKVWCLGHFDEGMATERGDSFGQIAIWPNFGFWGLHHQQKLLYTVQCKNVSSEASLLEPSIPKGQNINS